MDTLFEVAKGIIITFMFFVVFKNYIFLIVNPWYKVKETQRYIHQVLKRRKSNLPDNDNLKVSVIIPAWNEEVGILKTIKSVLLNGYDNIQVVVVNDGSTDQSDTIVKNFIQNLQEKHPKLAQKITYKYQPNGGKGVALNTGIYLADGDIILTVDADSMLKKGAIKKLTTYYLDPQIMAVVGNVKVTNTQTVIGLLQHLEYHFGFYNKRAHSLLGAEYIFGGACASFRADVFRTIGVFDTENKTEDIEMSMRTRFNGMQSTYAEDVICYTEGASDIIGLIKQRVRWKKGRIDTFIKYRSLFFSTEENHNFFLAFFILPYSVLTEIQLLLEPVAIAILVTYTIVTGEYLSLALGILFILLVYVITALFSNDKPSPGIILLFPFTWPLFYVLDWVESMALWKSLKIISQGKDVEWQRWNRTGLEGSSK